MNNYPIELFHWCGMPMDNVAEVQNILLHNPEFSRFTNKYGDDALFLSLKSNNIMTCKYLIESGLFDLERIYLSKDLKPDGNIFINLLNNSNIELAVSVLQKNSNLFYTILASGNNPLHIIFEKCLYDFFNSKISKKLIYNFTTFNGLGLTPIDSIIKSYTKDVNSTIYTLELFLESLEHVVKTSFINKLKDKIPASGGFEPLLNLLP